MAAFGATVNRVDGSYDDSIRIAAETAERQGWTVVSDTAWDGYEAIPLTVMQGYTAIAGEALDALDAPPTHIFVQAGVGGIAAAIAAYAHQRLGSAAPKIVVVEPARAACLHGSAKAGHAVTIPHGEPTVMAMLECYDPSPLALRVSRTRIGSVMNVPPPIASRASISYRPSGSVLVTAAGTVTVQ